MTVFSFFGIYLSHSSWASKFYLNQGRLSNPNLVAWWLPDLSFDFASLLQIAHINAGESHVNKLPRKTLHLRPLSFVQPQSHFRYFSRKFGVASKSRRCSKVGYIKPTFAYAVRQCHFHYKSPKVGYLLTVTGWPRQGKLCWLTVLLTKKAYLYKEVPKWAVGKFRGYSNLATISKMENPRQGRGQLTRRSRSSFSAKYLVPEEAHHAILWPCGFYQIGNWCRTTVHSLVLFCCSTSCISIFSLCLLITWCMLFLHCALLYHDLKNGKVSLQIL